MTLFYSEMFDNCELYYPPSQFPSFLINFSPKRLKVAGISKKSLRRMQMGSRSGIILPDFMATTRVSIISFWN